MIDYAKQGTILRTAREARGFNIKDMAEFAGYKTEMWRLIEKGVRQLSQDKIGKVARVLKIEDMTLKQFYGEEKAK